MYLKSLGATDWPKELSSSSRLTARSSKASTWALPALLFNKLTSPSMAPSSSTMRTAGFSGDATLEAWRIQAKKGTLTSWRAYQFCVLRSQLDRRLVRRHLGVLRQSHTHRPRHLRGTAHPVVDFRRIVVLAHRPLRMLPECLLLQGRGSPPDRWRSRFQPRCSCATSELIPSSFPIEYLVV